MNSRKHSPWLIVIGLALASADIAAGALAKRSTRITPDQLKWAPQAPNLPQQIATLWGHRERGPAGVFVKLPGGFDSGLHAHTADYHAVVVSGTFLHVDEDGTGAEQPLTAGAYVMQPGQGMHIDRCRVGAECILLIYQDQKADIIWPKKK